jgi:hypothetical protein
MRYFFRIVDRYGLSPDRAGYEHTDQESAVLHAKRIAAELAKAGEFFARASCLSLATVPEAIFNLNQGTAIPSTEGLRQKMACRFPAPALYRESLICGLEGCF